MAAALAREVDALAAAVLQAARQEAEGDAPGAQDSYFEAETRLRCAAELILSDASPPPQGVVMQLLSSLLARFEGRRAEIEVILSGSAAPPQQPAAGGG